MIVNIPTAASPNIPDMWLKTTLKKSNNFVNDILTTVNAASIRANARPCLIELCVVRITTGCNKKRNAKGDLLRIAAIKKISIMIIRSALISN